MEWFVGENTEYDERVADNAYYADHGVDDDYNKLKVIIMTQADKYMLFMSVTLNWGGCLIGSLLYAFIQSQIFIQ